MLTMVCCFCGTLDKQFSTIELLGIIFSVVVDPHKFLLHVPFDLNKKGDLIRISVPISHSPYSSEMVTLGKRAMFHSSLLLMRTSGFILFI